ncbi:unnamed protein product [Camellia sinensis]
MAAGVASVGLSWSSKLAQRPNSNPPPPLPSSSLLSFGRSIKMAVLVDEQKKTFTLKKSEQAFNIAKELMPGGVNSPVRAFKSVGRQPIIMDSVKGSKMWDIDGNKYIDYVGSWGPAIIGHADDEKNLMGGSTPGGSITYNDQPYSKFLESRIGFTLTKQEKEKRAIDVIDELGLERCQDTMIGSSFVRGVSGGERKRVCIGNEIIINPSLLFLDEPTSGLDSTIALRIIQILQDIAEEGNDFEIYGSERTVGHTV